MKRKYIIALISGLIFLFAGAGIGFLIGTYIGGNYFPYFAFWSFQGYEATGWIGIIVGGILGAVLGTILGFNLSKLDQYD